MYRMVSLDGGGIRGKLSARILWRIVQEYPLLLDQIDLVAGTSTGGLQAAAIAAGMDVDVISNLYDEHAEYIFQDSWWDNVRDLGNLKGAQYDADNLEQVLDGLFGSKKIGELEKKVFIPTFEVDREVNGVRTMSATFIHNYPGSRHLDYLVKRALLETAAAPTYFPSKGKRIDGGVAANNPSDCAIVQAECAGIRRQDMVMLSLGTGLVPKWIEGQDKKAWAIGEEDLDYGILDWAPHLVDIFMMASVTTSDRKSQIMLGCDRYHRIQPVLPRNIDLDDTGAIELLQQIADGVDLSGTFEFIEKQWLEQKPEA